MKTKLFFFITVFSFISMIVGATATWTQQASFPGPGRTYPIGFSIGTKGYIGTGTIGTSTYTDDFWEWDQPTNVWTQRANVPGGPRTEAISFSIGNKGYVALGATSAGGLVQDLWEWDQATNVWSAKANFTGASRLWSVGFSIGTHGYISTGNSGLAWYNDLWEWNQTNNVWTQKANLAGPARMGAVSFAIGTKGYIGTGCVMGSNTFKDFWEWDQTTNIWTQRADLPGTARTFAAGFSIGNKGFIGTGADKTGAPLKDFWKWDQATNTWIQGPDYGGGPIRDGVGFAIGNSGYIGAGSPNANKSNPVSTFWQYADSTCKISPVISSDPGSGTTLCVGQTVYVNASGGITYSWSNGASGANITLHPTTTTVYSVFVTNANGCTGTSSITLIVDTSCTATGVSSIYPDPVQATIFPSPFNQSATLIMTGTGNLEQEMKIFDMLGKEVRNVKFSGQELKLDRGSMMDGIYLYKIISKDQVIAAGKFIIGKL